MNLLEESGCYVVEENRQEPVGMGVDKDTSILPERA